MMVVTGRKVAGTAPAAAAAMVISDGVVGRKNRVDAARAPETEFASRQVGRRVDRKILKAALKREAAAVAAEEVAAVRRWRRV